MKTSLFYLPCVGTRQQMHGIHGARPCGHDRIDSANRAAFEECFRLVKMAWTTGYMLHGLLRPLLEGAGGGHAPADRSDEEVAPER